MACPTLTLTPPFTLLDPHVPPPPRCRAERLREDRYNISDEELRPYFALPNVLQGLFKVHTCMQHCDIMTVVMFVHISTGSHVLRPA